MTSGGSNAIGRWARIQSSIRDPVAAAMAGNGADKTMTSNGMDQQGAN